MKPHHHNVLVSQNVDNEMNSSNGVSVVADDRPITCCAFTNDGKYYLTSSVSGNLKVWSLPTFGNVSEIKAHSERITGLAINTKINYDSVDNPIIATSSADR